MNNYIHYKLSDETNYPFPNFNSAAIGVWEWILSYIFYGQVITYPCWYYVLKGDPGVMFGCLPASGIWVVRACVDLAGRGETWRLVWTKVADLCNRQTAWLRHNMEALPALLTLFEGNLPVIGGLPKMASKAKLSMCHFHWEEKKWQLNSHFCHKTYRTNNDDKIIKGTISRF